MAILTLILTTLLAWLELQKVLVMNASPELKAKISDQLLIALLQVHTSIQKVVNKIKDLQDDVPVGPNRKQRLRRVHRLKGRKRSIPVVVKKSRVQA